MLFQSQFGNFHSMTSIIIDFKEFLPEICLSLILNGLNLRLIEIVEEKESAL